MKIIFSALPEFMAQHPALNAVGANDGLLSFYYLQKAKWSPAALRP
jgi:hypothetical protein